MTEYVDELEQFVDKTNPSIKELVKKSLDEFHGRVYEPPKVITIQSEVAESESSFDEEQESVRRFYHGLINSFCSKRYLENGLKNFKEGIRRETFAEREIIDEMLLDDTFAS